MSAHRLAALLAVPLALVLADSSAPPATAAPQEDVAALIPDGVVTAEVLTPDYSPQMQDISRRLKNAADADPVWFQSWIAHHPAGPLPWSPHMNVTRSEYDLYMREGRVANYVVRTRVRLTFERTGPRRWTLHGWGLLGPIDGLVLDAGAGRAVSRRWGALPFTGVAHPTEATPSLPWRWYGVYKSAHVVGDPRTTGQSLEVGLHIGPLGDGSRAGLYWTARRLNRGRRLDDEFLLVRFPTRGH